MWLTCLKEVETETWQFFEKLGFNRARHCYEHKPEDVVENEHFKTLGYFTKECDLMIEARRLDIVVVDKIKKAAMIIDMTIPGERVCDKKFLIIKKYSLLKDEFARLWQTKKVSVIPIVFGALGAITT